MTTFQRESQVANEIGAKLQPRSGATPWAKEDFIDEVFLYQHKEMLTAKSHTVTRHGLEDLRCNAVDEGKDPCYIIEYEGIRWFMVSESDFLVLKALKLQ